jgi:Molybdopterin-binding domain of aldehyde dehydrogenase/[2Fe-2S] binding domain
MIMTAVALLASHPNPYDAAIVEALEGNVCRCCTYPRIVRAIRRAAESTDSPAAAPAQAREPTFVRPGVPWDLVEARERDWFGVLPDGLVVVAETARVDGHWSTTAGAWLHVGPDGAATAFTGKVDVGQGNRTALSLLVAAELGIPIESVRLVMGDTDLCPYDEGTFGSRSMADAGPVLPDAAAAARRTLERQPLAPGDRRVERAPGEVAALPVANKRRVDRQDGLAVVSGAIRFPGDLTRPGLLHGWVPATGARVRSLPLLRDARL